LILDKVQPIFNFEECCLFIISKDGTKHTDLAAVIPELLGGIWNAKLKELSIMWDSWGFYRFSCFQLLDIHVLNVYVSSYFSRIRYLGRKIYSSQDRERYILAIRMNIKKCSLSREDSN
jgi:hypothetical protein